MKNTNTYFEELAKIGHDFEEKRATHEAKKQQIELAGDLTEKERFQMEIERDVKISYAKYIAEGLNGMTLPKILMVNAGKPDNGSGTSASSFIDLLNIKLSKDLAEDKKEAE